MIRRLQPGDVVRCLGGIEGDPDSLGYGVVLKVFISSEDVYGPDVEVMWYMPRHRRCMNWVHFEQELELIE